MSIFKRRIKQRRVIKELVYTVAIKDDILDKISKILNYHTAEIKRHEIILGEICDDIGKHKA